MITILQEPKEWTSQILDYNEQKFWNGQAEVIHSANMVNPGPHGVYDSIVPLEMNPEIHGSVKKRSFQMTVNPLPSDFGGDPERGIPPDENLVRGYIDEVMDGIGMGGQPYVVYRHHDIDRVHYHVVSTRCRPDGKLVSDSYWVYTIKRLERSLSEKYRFVQGRNEVDEKESDEIARKTEKYVPGTKGVRKVTRSLFERTLAKRYRSPWEFQCQLAAVGLEMISVRGESGKSYFIGLNDDGTRAKSRGITDQHVFVEGGKAVAEGVRAHGGKPCSGKVVAERMMMLSDWAMARTHSFREYRALMASFGVVPTVKRHPEKTGAIRAVAIVARKGGSLISSTYGEVPLEPFVRKESTGEWTVETKRRKPVDVGTLATKAERNRILDRLEAVGKKKGAGVSRMETAGRSAEKTAKRKR